MNKMEGLEAIKAQAAIVKQETKKLDDLVDSFVFPPVCYVVVEANHGYGDSWKRGRYLTRQEAEQAKPEDSNSGWEPCTYSIVEEPTANLAKHALKGLLGL